MIWASDAAKIKSKFKAATGMDLAAGLQVLVLIAPQITALYGLGFSITDIDPSYTLGDMEAKLKRIRATIAEKGEADRNRSLPTPTDFFRVGVISPANAAGLEDFKAGAAILAAAGLCEFQYFGAIFQGENAKKSICDAMIAAHAAREERGFDALVIIRGGGAVVDLHWLAETEIARSVCRFHCPVFTGIGHERDKSILDEYANRAFGTPSKVIAFIKDTIQSKAQKGFEDWRDLTQVVVARLDNAQAKIDANRTVITTCIERHLAKTDAVIESSITAVRSRASTRLDRVEAVATQANQSIAADAMAAIDLAEAKVVHRYASISERAEAKLVKAQTNSDNAFASITLASQRSIDGIDDHMQELIASVRASVTTRVATAEASIDRHAQDTKFLAAQRLDRAERENQTLMENIMAHGVGPTLRRGFALVRNANGPVSTKELAQASTELEIEFRDGTITLNR